MAVFHDEVEIEDFQYDEDSETYFYPCPCGDNFSITKEDLENGEDVATCPSCSLIIKVIYDKVGQKAGKKISKSTVTKGAAQGAFINKFYNSPKGGTISWRQVALATGGGGESALKEMDP
ncbi:diphthamide biosynthesis protein 3 isoform X2 [Marmota flaviventris]|uniref:diphthamide biosynthesis protein 3 isoform X2 n=1 Tax=Marmota flaviventris TaxID=93162 RepID=UPI003A87907A